MASQCKRRAASKNRAAQKLSACRDKAWRADSADYASHVGRLATAIPAIVSKAAEISGGKMKESLIRFAMTDLACHLSTVTDDVKRASMELRRLRALKALEIEYGTSRVPGAFDFSEASEKIGAVTVIAAMSQGVHSAAEDDLAALPSRKLAAAIGKIKTARKPVKVKSVKVKPAASKPAASKPAASIGNVAAGA